MPNTFLALPAPASNGAGAGVDVSGMGASKTVIVTGTWVLAPEITIEINNDPAQAGSWAALETFNSGSGVGIYAVAAKWMRARVSNFQGGQAPVVNVGSSDDGATFASLPSPSGNGSGAPVNTSSLGLFKTIHIGGGFGGNVIVEVSTDGITEWGQVASVQSAGFINLTFAAQFMRVTRSGVPSTSTGSPVVNIGGSAGSGGGSVSGVFQAFDYVFTGVETTHFAVVMPHPMVTLLYGVTFGPQTEPDTFSFSWDTPGLLQFNVRTSAQVPAGRKVTLFVAELQ